MRSVKCKTVLIKNITNEGEIVLNMNKKNVIVILCSIIIVAFCSVQGKAAAQYSFDNIGLDYQQGIGGHYGRGKNGYSFIEIIKVDGNRLVYRNTKMVYKNDYNFKSYGKKKVAKLTGKTKYYLGSPQKVNKKIIEAFQKNPYMDITPHGQFFKQIKWLRNVNNKKFSRKCTPYFTYAKVKQGKAIVIVSGLNFR